eukprot:gnl/Chilomastix_caulleri/1789.p1 GENE.gnl/Chilomastix_caulleri/1789~~gnl/Chilomastix_caulleri/1789.p1  ORF type:complete len:74 (-),score=4.58 gnl/Chilomastix_caulleri/1789:158-379(-)
MSILDRSICTQDTGAELGSFHIAHGGNYQSFEGPPAWEELVAHCLRFDELVEKSYDQLISDWMSHISVRLQPM